MIFLPKFYCTFFDERLYLKLLFVLFDNSSKNGNTSGNLVVFHIYLNMEGRKSFFSERFVTFVCQLNVRDGSEFGMLKDQILAKLLLNATETERYLKIYQKGWFFWEKNVFSSKLVKVADLI